MVFFLKVGGHHLNVFEREVSFLLKEKKTNKSEKGGSLPIRPLYRGSHLSSPLPNRTRLSSDLPLDVGSCYTGLALASLSISPVRCGAAPGGIGRSGVVSVIVSKFSGETFQPERPW